MRVPAAGEDRKFAVFGAVDYASGRMLHQMSARKGEEAFLAFLDQLAQAFPSEEVVVVLDNVGYHKSHARVVAGACAAHSALLPARLFA